MRGRLLLVLVAGLALRLWLFYAVPRDLGGDAHVHVRVAQNLALGHGYSHGFQPPYHPDLGRAPLLPLLLAAVIALGQGPILMLLIQCALDVGTMLLVRRNFGLLAAGIYFLAPYPACWVSLPLTESLSVFLFTLTLDRVLAKGTWSLGLAAGLLCLSRPALLPIAVVMILATARRKQLVIALALVALITLPWALRNASVPGGRFTPLTLTSFGATLWPGINDDYGLNLSKGKGRDLYERYWRGHYSREDLSPAEAMELDNQLKAIALESIRENPGTYLVHVLHQAFGLWWKADDSLINWRTENWPLYSFIQWSQRLLVILAFLGLPRYPRAGLILLLFTGLYAPIHVESRYMLPCEPILAVLAAGLKETLFRPRTRQQVAP